MIAAMTPPLPSLLLPSSLPPPTCSTPPAAVGTTWGPGAVVVIGAVCASVTEAAAVNAVPATPVLCDGEVVLAWAGIVEANTGTVTMWLAVGETVGLSVGLMVGKMVGKIVGDIVGKMVGKIVGDIVCKMVGKIVGDIVGKMVGATVDVAGTSVVASIVQQVC